MLNAEIGRDERAIVFGRLRLVGHNADDGRVDTGSYRPDMQIGNAIVAVLDGLSDPLADVLRSLVVQQNSGGATQKSA